MLPLFLISLFLGGIVSTVAGGGLSVISLSIAGSILPPVQAVALSALLTLIMQTGKAVAFRHKIFWKYALIFSTVGIPASMLGAYFLILLPSQFIGIVLGVACIASVLHHRLIPQKPLAGTMTQLLVTGGVGGFMTGFLGYGGGMRLAVLRRMNLTPQELIATGACTALLTNIGRIPIYLTQLEWTQELLTIVLSAVPVIALAVAIGKSLHSKISVHTLEYAIDVVVVIGGITMIVRSL